jgi:hypothetical protein
MIVLRELSKELNVFDVELLLVIQRLIKQYIDN